MAESYAALLPCAPRVSWPSSASKYHKVYIQNAREPVKLLFADPSSFTFFTIHVYTLLSSVNLIIRSFDRCFPCLFRSLSCIAAFSSSCCANVKHKSSNKTALSLAHSYAFESNCPPVSSCADAFHLCVQRTEGCCSLPTTGHSVSCFVNNND